MLLLLLGLFCVASLPARAEDDYDTSLDRHSLQLALVRKFSSPQDYALDPIALTLSYLAEVTTTLFSGS